MAAHEFEFVTDVPKRKGAPGPRGASPRPPRHFMWFMPPPDGGKMASKTVHLDVEADEESRRAEARRVITRLLSQGRVIRQRSGENRRFSGRTLFDDAGVPRAVMIVRTK